VGRHPAQGVPEELSGWRLVCGIDQRTVRRVGLIVNAIVLYNTIYTQRALHASASASASASALTIDDPDIERLSPLGTDHITLTGRYRIALLESLRDRGAHRELNTMPALAA
jgi:hypothetical protein